ncbi:MAG TPA: hypothetical protein VFU63_01450 [Ktedonobacterales bacterium]|nr:hypothetical protein [Ktedonobacterales bacterium]
MAILQGDDLCLYSLADLEHPVLVVPRAVAHHLLPDRLIVCTTSGTIAQWVLQPSGLWQETAHWQMSVPPAVAERENHGNVVDEMKLSPSGRFVLAKHAVWDATNGAHLFATGGYAAFVTLADGREGVLGAVDDLYGLELRDCVSGALLRRYYRPGEEDFIHREFLLSRDATRLFVFGCYWACPWGIRMYDFSPWRSSDNAGTEDTSDELMPLLFEGYDGPWTLLPVGVHAVTEEQVTIYGYVDLTQGAPSEDDVVLAGNAPSTSGYVPTMFDELGEVRRAGHQAAVVARVLELSTGNLRSFTVRAVLPTKEWGLHQLRGSRLMLLNTRAELFDGTTGAFTDLGAIDVPAGWFRSVATSDGELVILRDYTVAKG